MLRDWIPHPSSLPLWGQIAVGVGFFVLLIGWFIFWDWFTGGKGGGGDGGQGGGGGCGGCGGG
jgi:hypothetical protein